jgi:transposase
MPRPRLPFVRHRTVNQIRARYRACRHPVEKTRWHALWLPARTDDPRTPAQVADLVGLSAVTVREILHRWNDHGPDGVADGRKDNGAEAKLTPRRRDALHAALRERPPDGGLWSGPKVARYARDRWGVAVCPETGWRWLVGWGSASRSHRRATPTRPTRRPAGPGKKLETPGEATAGREPGQGRRGVGRGRGEAGAQAGHPAGVVAAGVPAPVGRSGGRAEYEWPYAYGFARPETGRTFTVTLPRVKVERMAQALAAFAEHADPAGEKILVLVVDRAGWHAAGRPSVPANVRLHFPPPARRSCGRSSRSGRWSGRRWRTRRSAGWPTSGG